MKKIIRAKVYHDAFGDSGECVAIVNLNGLDLPEDAIQILNFVYRKTNTIECPWWHNLNVEIVGPAKLAGGCRSTSAGDRIILEMDDNSAELYKVENFGFSKVQREDIACSAKTR